MTVNLPVVLVLGIVAWLIVKFFRIRPWAVVALVLFGFFLAHTFMAPAIDSGTRTGVQIVNTHH
jgi:F0F1-type ATP synthase assembly protein I